MRRVAPFCACCNRSPTSLASLSAIAILAQAIGNIPLAASLCIPRARERLQPTVVRLAPVDHWSLTRASRSTERTFACTSQCRAQARHTHWKIKTTFCSFVLTRCEVSVGRGVESTQVGGRTAYYKYGQFSLQEGVKQMLSPSAISSARLEIQFYYNFDLSTQWRLL